MALSPNFGFPEPDNSSLVKNGAQDIRALGDSIDAFLNRPFTTNSILNSSFNVWQRGTSFTGNGYTADRWRAGAATRTFSQQAAALDGFEYSMRVQRDLGSTGTADTGIAQTLELSNTLQYRGKTLTFSFYAKAGADFSAASSQMKIQVGTGTTANQAKVPGAVSTGQALIVDQNQALTTSWQRFSFTTTGAVSSSANNLFVNLFFTAVGTAGANDWFEVTGVQLEVGSVATPYTPNQPTYASELAASQRYYYRAVIPTTPARFGVGMVNSTTTAEGFIQFPTIMRTSPTALEQSGTAADYSIFSTGGVATNCSAVPAFNTATPFGSSVTYTVASGLTGGQAVIIRASNTSAYLGWSAEL